MKLTCITIKQPWAWLIAEGFKTIENRTWQTNFRGKLGIHVGKSNTDFNLAILKSIEKKGVALPSVDDLKQQQGFIIATTKITQISNSGNIWAIPGQFHWKLEKPQKIKPIKAVGKLGLWNYNLDSNLIYNDSAQIELPKLQLQFSPESFAIAHGLIAKDN